MSRGPGRIERAIRALFDAHPDDAFTTADLCRACYPDARRIEHKHVVAVTRAAKKVLAHDPDWRRRLSPLDRRTLDVCNLASAPSQIMWGRLRRYWATQEIRPAEKEVAEYNARLHIARRDGETAEAERLRALLRALVPEPKPLGQLAHEIRATLDPVYVLTTGIDRLHQHLAEIAAMARRLITENDPDAVRALATEIADALDALSQKGEIAEQRPRVSVT